MKSGVNLLSEFILVCKWTVKYYAGQWCCAFLCVLCSVIISLKDKARRWDIKKTKTNSWRKQENQLRSKHSHAPPIPRSIVGSYRRHHIPSHGLLEPRAVVCLREVCNLTVYIVLSFCLNVLVDIRCSMTWTGEMQVKLISSLSFKNSILLFLKI